MIHNTHFWTTNQLPTHSLTSSILPIFFQANKIEEEEEEFNEDENSYNDEEPFNEDNFEEDEYYDEDYDYDKIEKIEFDIWDVFDVDPEEFGGDEDMLYEYFGRG